LILELEGFASVLGLIVVDIGGEFESAVRPPPSNYEEKPFTDQKKLDLLD
jgi:hypothetical protein